MPPPFTGTRIRRSGATRFARCSKTHPIESGTGCIAAAPCCVRKLAKWLFEHSITQVIYFHESNSGHVIYTAHDGGVVTCGQVSNDCRLPWVPRNVAAVPAIDHLLL